MVKAACSYLLQSRNACSIAASHPLQLSPSEHPFPSFIPAAYAASRLILHSRTALAAPRFLRAIGPSGISALRQSGSQWTRSFSPDRNLHRLIPFFNPQPVEPRFPLLHSRSQSSNPSIPAFQHGMQQRFPSITPAPMQNPVTSFYGAGLQHCNPHRILQSCRFCIIESTPAIQLPTQHPQAAHVTISATAGAHHFPTI